MLVLINLLFNQESDIKKYTTPTLKAFKWGKDRFSHLGYDLFTIYFSKKFDCYLFKYKENSYIPRHKDPSFGYDHHIRFNFVLKKPEKGGTFYCNKMIYSGFNNRLFIFDASKSYHKIDKITKGTRYLLGIGIRFNNNSLCFKIYKKVTNYGYK